MKMFIYHHHHSRNGGNILRKETREKIAQAVMEAIENEEISTVEDIEKIIDVASMTDKQKDKLDKVIEAHENKLERLKNLRDKVA